MVDEYARGQRDGLRIALAVLAKEEAKWSALLGQSRSWRTNATREIRYKALKVGQSRIQTALARLMRKDPEAVDDDLAMALEKVGL